MLEKGLAGTVAFSVCIYIFVFARTPHPCVRTGRVLDKGLAGTVVEIEKDGDTWPAAPAWGAARIDFGGDVGEQWVSKEQFQSLAGEVLPERQVDDATAYVCMHLCFCANV